MLFVFNTKPLQNPPISKFGSSGKNKLGLWLVKMYNSLDMSQFRNFIVLNSVTANDAAKGWILNFKPKSNVS